MLLVEFPGMFALVICYGLNFELKAVMREVKDGMYSPLTYFLVLTIIQIPALAILTVCCLIPALYPMLDAPWEGFGGMWLIFAMQLWALECLAALNALEANVMVGLMTFIEEWSLFFLFNGITIPTHSVIWPFRVFCYVSPYKWAQPVLTYEFFNSAPMYNDAFQCNVTTQRARHNVSLPVTCQGPPDGEGFGYYCSGVAAACFGRSGHQILAGINHYFPAIYDVGSDWLGLTGFVAIAVIVCKVAFLGQFVVNSSKADVPKPSKDSALAAADSVGSI